MPTLPLDEVPQPARPTAPTVRATPTRATTLRVLDNAPRCAHVHPAQAPSAPHPPCLEATPVPPPRRSLTRPLTRPFVCAAAHA